ncbi:MAG TPA: dihydrodipicolinate synthase family protein [Solirubrobacteraceae bacterium]|nr:dihydrodipicolinate synthase family protein [Solirubrobacteraceae bacterium]
MSASHAQELSMRFPGIIPAVTTPFTENDTIDFAALGANVDALVRGGVHGLVATGTMGESASLDLDERKAVTAAICEAAGGRIPVLAGIAAPTARLATLYALAAQEAGATALMMLPPLNYNGDFREISAYFAAVGQATGMEIMAYNNPGASGVELSVEMIARLGNEVESVVAVKECSGETRNIAAIIGATGDDFEVVVGGDDFALEGFCAGATGWVSGVANVLPSECVKLYEACREGELATAREIYQRMLPLARLDFDPKLVQYFKGAMDQVGFTGGLCREPRMPLSAADREILAHAMDVLGAAPVAQVA